jgi:hypothetical protein
LLLQLAYPSVERPDRQQDRRYLSGRERLRWHGAGLGCEVPLHLGELALHTDAKWPGLVAFDGLPQLLNLGHSVQDRPHRALDLRLLVSKV